MPYAPEIDVSAVVDDIATHIKNQFEGILARVSKDQLTLQENVNMILNLPIVKSLLEEKKELLDKIKKLEKENIELKAQVVSSALPTNVEAENTKNISLEVRELDSDTSSVTKEEIVEHIKEKELEALKKQAQNITSGYQFWKQQTSNIESKIAVIPGHFSSFSMLQDSDDDPVYSTEEEEDDDADENDDDDDEDEDEDEDDEEENDEEDDDDEEEVEERHAYVDGKKLELDDEGLPIIPPSDIEIALQEAEEKGEFESEEEEEDREAVKTAVAQDGNALCLAAEFKNDKEIVMIAVAQNGDALRYASNELKKDKDVVMAAVKQNGNALRYALLIWCATENKFKMDKEVVLAAVAQNGDAIQYASDELKKDKDVLKASVSHNMTKNGDDSEEDDYEDDEDSPQLNQFKSLTGSAQVESQNKEEEEEVEEYDVEEIELDGIKYYTTDPDNGIVYEYADDGEIGEEIGRLEEGNLFLS